MPTANENKVKYGLKNVYYAIATIAADGSATYDTPVKFPGAVSLSLDAQGENTPFYADNIVYFVGSSNTGYEGDLEMARITDSFREDVLGETADTKNVLVERVDAPVVHFALLFQFEGDQKAVKHVLYNCTATRPTIGSATKEDTVEPETETVTITATSIYSETLQSDIVKARSNKDTDDTTYNAWFNTVYLPT